MRQLHNVLRTAVALADGGVIGRQHLIQDFLDEMHAKKVDAEPAAVGIAALPAASLKVQNDEAIRQAMLQHGGNISAVSRQLGLSRNTLYRRLKALNLS